MVILNCINLFSFIIWDYFIKRHFPSSIIEFICKMQDSYCLSSAQDNELAPRQLQKVTN